MASESNELRRAKDARWIDIHEDDLNEAQMATWVRQAAVLPGWVP